MKMGGLCIVENKAQEHAIENESALPLLRRRHHETKRHFHCQSRRVSVYFIMIGNIQICGSMIYFNVLKET